MILLPGDALLYRPASVYGKLIEFHTGHDISHVEVYVGLIEGSPKSVASRDGIGTGLYPARVDPYLAWVCRPKTPIDVAKGLAWFQQQPHRPYGWFDLLYFVDWRVPAALAKGVVCSPLADEFWCACDFDAFNYLEPPVKIAPYEFAVTPLVNVLPFAGGMLYA